MIVDLPTPPLPEPTQTTFETCASAPSGSPPAAELLLQPGLLLVGEDVEGDVDALDALERADRRADGGLEVAADRAAGRRQRDGDGARARRRRSIERTIPSSTIERRSSGSMTASSALRISSRDGMPSILAEGSSRPALGPTEKRPAVASRFEGGEVLLCRRVWDRQPDPRGPSPGPGRGSRATRRGDALRTSAATCVPPVMPVCTRFSTRAPSRSAWRRASVRVERISRSTRVRRWRSSRSTRVRAFRPRARSGCARWCRGARTLRSACRRLRVAAAPSRPSRAR